MFRCELCGHDVPPKIKPKIIVMQQRPSNYPYRERANRPASWREDRQDRIDSGNDRGGKGWEIAREVKACSNCAKKFEEGEIVPTYTTKRQ